MTWLSTIPPIGTLTGLPQLINHDRDPVLTALLVHHTHQGDSDVEE